LISEASDYAVEYWILRKPGIKAKDSTPELKAKLQLMESRIDGYQQRVNLFFLLIQLQLKTGDRDALVNLMADFFDALTGGNFGAEAREKDLHRAKLVYANGTGLVAHLRKTRPCLTWSPIAFGFIVFLGFLFLVVHPFVKVMPRDWVAI
jgi:hypothetical protein